MGYYILTEPVLLIVQISELFWNPNPEVKCSRLHRWTVPVEAQAEFESERFVALLLLQMVHMPFGTIWNYKHCKCLIFMNKNLCMQFMVLFIKA